MKTASRWNWVAWAVLFVYTTLGFAFTDHVGSDRQHVDNVQNAKLCVLIDRVVAVQELRAGVASNQPVPDVSSASPDLRATIEYINARSLALNTKALALTKTLHC